MKFTYNNTKNASIDHIIFELNCEYYSHIFYKKNLDLCSKLNIAKTIFQTLKSNSCLYLKPLPHIKTLKTSV